VLPPPPPLPLPPVLQMLQILQLLQVSAHGVSGGRLFRQSITTGIAPA
jgi:hypothetical protein